MAEYINNIRKDLKIYTSVNYQLEGVRFASIWLQTRRQENYGFETNFHYIVNVRPDWIYCESLS